MPVQDEIKDPLTGPNNKHTLFNPPLQGGGSFLLCFPFLRLILFFVEDALRAPIILYNNVCSGFVTFLLEGGCYIPNQGVSVISFK
jgi:hypothetical protein